MSTAFVHRAHRAPYDINPTLTSLVVLDVRQVNLVTVTFKNPDGAQTVSVTFNSRTHRLDDLAPRAVLDELTNIPAGATRTADLSLGAAYELEVLAQASGLGITGATLTVVPGDDRP